MPALTVGDRLLAWGAVPDLVLRPVVRGRVRSLLRSFDRLSPQESAAREATLLSELESGPITVRVDDANRQHYELPAAFFAKILGPRLKYSSCYWPTGVLSLPAAEEEMLRLTADRARLRDGQMILDLGCGWGSFSLWAAERFPNSEILAVSNSRLQREFIETRAREAGLANVRVITADVAGFDPGRRFDRIVSVEMLEHVRNHKALFGRVADWLEPEGLFFVHVFCHRQHLYAFEDVGEGSWMARHFFSGGLMPSWDYLTRYQEHLSLLERWEVEGTHYALTLRTWLETLDARRAEVMPLLVDTYGADKAGLWMAYWRLFFIACEETFALDGGRAYFVGHYLFGGKGLECVARHGREQA